jgi:opacity protein-like surface antigen
MKRLALLCGALLLFAGIASAQDETPKVEAFGGYSYLHVSDNGAGASFNGGSGSLAYNFTPMLGVVADFGGYHWSNSGVDANVISYLFGPKIAYRHGAVTPYAQVLFGGAHISGGAGSCADVRIRPQGTLGGCGTGSENAFAMTVGGGVDWNATPHIGIRLVQAEYLLTKFNDGLNNRQNNARISTGVVFRW